MLTDAFLTEAEALLPGVMRRGEALAPHLVEMRGLMKGTAEAVFHPRTTAEVAAVVGLCARHKVRMVAQGGNTGLVGGGLPFGGVVISLAKMSRIEPVDAANATLSVEAGAILAQVQAVAAAAGFLFPLSLASEGSCTLGGNIAANAGGTAVLRYGNTRDLVLGLEAVLPDGRIFNALSGLRKDNAGYDLKHLFIGSEGTLGIVTRATLRLFPAPRTYSTAFVGTGDAQSIVALFARLRALAGERLTTFEILPRFGLEVVLRHMPNTRDPLAAAHLHYALIELSTPAVDAPLDTLMETVLAQALEAGEIEDAVLATSNARRDDFWRLREHLSDAQRFEGGSIKHDVSVPISRVADFLAEATRACEAMMPGLRVCAFGHIGDGNIHFNLTQPVGMAKSAFLSRWLDFNAVVHELVAARGGSIAAEHGVGLFKRDELPRYKDPVALALMAGIKHTLDPDNLMNPGKVVRAGADLPVFTPAGGQA
jgi:FAD/FMN-containing dehydrogenase